MTPYNVVTFDLATVVTPPVKIARTDGKRVTAISVTAMPAGTAAYIRVGSPNADRITLSVNKTIELDPAEPDGVFYENPLAGAGTLELTISYETACECGGKGQGLAVFTG